MRVLYLTDSLSDLDGVGRYTYRLIAALEKLHPELEVEILLARKHRPTSDAIPDHSGNAAAAASAAHAASSALPAAARVTT